MMKSAVARTGDIAELGKLKAALGMSNVQVGQSIYDAGKSVYNECCLWTSEKDLADPENSDRRKVDKMLFLSDRVFAKEESEEAYRYETLRVGKLFGLYDKFAMDDRVAAIAVPFYQRALSSTRTKLDTVSADMLQRARGTIGIPDDTRDDLHQATYLAEVEALLAKGSFDADDMDRLAQMQEVLELEDFAATRLREQLTLPLFTHAIETTVADATPPTSDRAGLYASIIQRQGELRIGDESATAALVKTFRNILEGILVEASGFVSVENNADAATEVATMIRTKRAVVSLMAKSGLDAAAVAATYLGEKPIGSLIKVDQKHRTMIYSGYLAQTLLANDNRLDDESQQNLLEFEVLTGIDPADTNTIYADVCGPLLKNMLEEVSSDMINLAKDPAALAAARDKIADTVANLHTPLSSITEYKRNVYEARLDFANSMCPGGILSAELSDALTTVKGLLDLDERVTDAMHMAAFGDAYRKSVFEAMGSTGIIPQEYAGFLTKLRERLMLTEKDAADLFHSAIGTKVKPMVIKLLLENDRANMTPEQESQKYGTDMGEDLINAANKGNLGMGVANNFMGECMNMVDFYTENNIAVRKEVGTKTVEKKVTEGGEEKTVTEEVPVFETTYPVNAFQLKVQKNEKDLENLYRNYLANSFMCEDKAQAARYEKQKAAFGGILGLSPNEMERIGGSIGGIVYDNYVKQVTQTKSKLDQQDMMFLANIKTKLGMSDKDCEVLLLEGQRKLARNQIQTIMALTGENKAKAIRAFREECTANGVDIVGDLNIEQPRVDMMMKMDVEYAINNGDTDAMEDIQEGYALTQEGFQELLTGMVLAKVGKYITSIQADIREGKEANALFYIRQLIKYITMFDEDMDIGLEELDAIERKKVIAIYRAASDAVPAELEALTATLG
mmetsp:Transcript_29676/g.58792  ORF Transcript_29676/g.58792 Transcript_29676/m.58792 type:complete len:907 (+) Transcript_29676:483-3203(+)